LNPDRATTQDIKSDAPRVVTVLLNYNQYDFTRDAIESLEESEWKNNQIIVVDNQSSDDSVNRLKKEYPNVKLIEVDSNLGCSGGRNLGAQKALDVGADYVFFMDNDALASKECIGRLVLHLNNEPSLGLVGPKVMQHPETDLVSILGTVIEWDSCRYYALQEEPREMPADHLIDAAWVAGTAWMVRASIFEEVGFLDDRYFIYFEDTDFSLRIQRKGYRTAVAADAQIWHRSRSSLGVGSPTLTYYYARNRILFFSTYSPNPKKSQRFLLFHGFLWGLRLALKGKWALAGSVFSGIKDALLKRWGCRKV
jgi:GT2 family glycosyltransferase